VDRRVQRAPAELTTHDRVGPKVPEQRLVAEANGALDALGEPLLVLVAARAHGHSPAEPFGAERQRADRRIACAVEGDEQLHAG
jgi:hypothetical protein